MQCIGFSAGVVHIISVIGVFGRVVAAIFCGRRAVYICGVDRCTIAMIGAICAAGYQSKRNSKDNQRIFFHGHGFESEHLKIMPH